MKLLFKTHLPILSISFIVLLIHLYNNVFTTYGMFRDELYYIACSEHLSAGYVDQPPLSIFVLWVNRLLFGDSVGAVRFLPSLAHAVTVFIAGILSFQLGGKKFARIVAALCVAFAPGIMGMFGIYSMNAFDILLWSLIFYLVIQLNQSQHPKYWIWIGIVIGAGLLNKISMGWLAVGLTIGVVATPMRKWLKTPYPWIAAGISVLIFLPFVIWNIQNDFSHLEFARNAAGVKYSSLDRIAFFMGMIDNFNPLAFPIWIAGFWTLFNHKQRELQSLFFSILTVLAILLINGHSKTEYFNPAVVLLFAAGSVSIEQWFATGWKRKFVFAYFSIVILMGIVLIPFAIDVLPVETFIQYSRSLGEKPSSLEGKKMRELPQHYADRLGWKELTEDVASVYSTLSVEEKSNAVIYGQNYGEASAINFYGKNYDLPKCISGHNSYWLWGYGNANSNVVIVIGGKKENYLNVFEDVLQAAIHSHPYAMPYESELPIFICRKLKTPLASLWEKTKHYD